MDRKNIDILLKKAYRSFSETIAPAQIKKIIPIAFPVLQSTWLIKIATTESSGLIDRYILRILKSFGPCGIEKIDEILCLGTERIEHALAEMEKLGSPISHSGNKFSFASNGDIEHFHVEQEHEFTFCINGISGDLLPIDFCKKSKNAEIDNLQEEQPLYVKLTPIVNGSESKLLVLRSGTDAQKISEGVPDGFMQLIGKAPRQEYCRYYLAFAVVTTDDHITVYCGGNATIALSSIQNYLAQIPEIVHILEKDDVLEAQYEGLSVFQKGNSISIKVNDNSLWNCFLTDDLSTSSIFIMRDFIKNGWLWDTYSRKFSHYTLFPEDETTAKALFISKASYELEHCYVNLDTRQETEKWLQGYYMSNNNSVTPCPELNDILKPLQKSANSEVRDFARMLLLQKETNIYQYTFDRSFHDSTEKDWQNLITDWLKKARETIQIITPVIDSDQVFNVLGEANAHGVYVQIITSLLDRNGKIKTTGDKQFSAMQIPGQKLSALGASVRATSNIPHAKIIIIDKSIVLFMSANLNDNSLGLGRVNAIETCILLQESSFVTGCIDLFDSLWESANYIQGTNQNSTFIVQKAGKSISEIPCMFKGTNEHLVFSCPQNLALEKTIMATIKKANTEIILMAMSFYDLEKLPDLFNILLELLSQKVSIKLLVRTGIEQFNESEWPDESTKRLLSAGMELFEIPHLHAKGVIVDNEEVLVMSANINPFSLGNTATSHIECGLLALDNSAWAKQFMAFTKDLIKRCQ